MSLADAALDLACLFQRDSRLTRTIQTSYLLTRKKDVSQSGELNEFCGLRRLILGKLGHNLSQIRAILIGVPFLRSRVCRCLCGTRKLLARGRCIP
jgi:hypothetical protein